MPQATAKSAPGARMLELLNSFPTLRGIMTEWDALFLEQWACGPVPGSGGFLAAQFVLEVWNVYEPWKCGRFDFHRALGVWDEEHRSVFLRWVQEPWYL